MSKSISTLAVGSKIEIPVKSAFHSAFGSKIVFVVVDKNHEGYPANSATLQTLKILRLMPADAAEPNNANANRRNYGNSRYLYSNVRQWLNSAAGAGEWYSPQHSADEPPSAYNDAFGGAYDTLAGFLSIFDTQFTSVLLPTTLITAKTNWDGGGQEICVDKMFLASVTEMGFANQNNIVEGSILSWHNTAANRNAQCTEEALNNSTYPSKPTTSGNGQYWLRTPLVSAQESLMRVVNGSTGGTYAYYGHVGVRPLCNIPATTLVGDTVNADGNYEIIWNTAPSAPPSITAPNSAYSGQAINLSCGAAIDPDGDAVSYIWERAYNGGAYAQVQSSSALTFTETVPSTWNTIRYRVKARDAYENESAYIYTEVLTVIHNQPPVISGQNADLGTKREGFTYDYSVTDADNDIVNVVEKVDGVPFATKNNVTLGQTNTASVTGNVFTGLTNAEHALSITATDSAGNAAMRVITFEKAINGFEITLTDPLETSTQPKRCSVIVNREIPAGGTFKVEVSNNPFDAAPTWEDCTTAVLQGMAHVFSNTVNAALSFGFNVRVTVGRGDAVTTCWVSGIGGNFE